MRIPDYRPSCLCLFIRHINKQLRLQAASLLICMTELLYHVLIWLLVVPIDQILQGNIVYDFRYRIVQFLPDTNRYAAASSVTVNWILSNTGNRGKLAFRQS